MDNQDLAGAGGGNPGQGQGAWLQAAQQYLAQGGQLDQSGQWDPPHGKFGTPLGYAVQGNQLVPDTNLWGSIWPGLLGVAGMGSLGAVLGPAASAATAASGGPAAALQGADASLLPSSPISGGLFGAPSSVPSGAMAAASGGSALSAASPLMKALAGVGGLIGGNLAGRAASSAAVPSQLTDLLNTMNQRTQAQTPVFNAVQQGTWTGLPSYATQGLTPPKAI